MANSVAMRNVDASPTVGCQGAVRTALKDPHFRPVNRKTSIPRDGLIYQRIRHYQRTKEKVLERQWWSELTKSKTIYLKQFWSVKNSALCSAMERLLHIPCIWLDLEIGMLPKIIALHCNEEIIHYFNYIYRAWSVLCAHDLSIMNAIDYADVQLLQSRVPKISPEDMMFLRKHFEVGRLFSSLDTKERHQLWDRFQQRTQTMPGFFTFFKDFNFLSILQSVVKHLVAWPPPESLSQSLESHFHAYNAAYVQCEYRERMFERRKTAPQDNFKKCYLQLWLFAMRHWWETTRFRHRKGSKKRTGTTDELLLLPYLADLAMEIGFTSSRIQKMASASRNDTIPSTQPRVNMLIGTSMRQRCGIPFLPEQASDQGNLFLGPVLDPAIPEGISSLFLRRCFISAFWYDLDGDTAATIDCVGVHDSASIYSCRDPEEENITAYYDDARERYTSMSDDSVYDDESLSRDSAMVVSAEENREQSTSQKTVRFWIFDYDRVRVQKQKHDEKMVKNTVTQLARENFLILTTRFMCVAACDAFRVLSESKEDILLFSTPSHQRAARIAYAAFEGNTAESNEVRSIRA